MHVMLTGVDGNAEVERGRTNAQFSFTVLNTICSSTQRLQPNASEDGHIDGRNM